MGRTWRDRARPIIIRVLEENKDQDEKEIRKALRDAYPFGERALHPYKIWCDEIKVQRGKRKFGYQLRRKEDPNQANLFS